MGSALVLFSLQPGSESGIRFVGIGVAIVGVGFVVRCIARTPTGVAWGRAKRAITIVWRIDGFGGLVPLRFLGIDVDVEPGVGCELEKRRLDLRGL